jgi:hypothetical protein
VRGTNGVICTATDASGNTNSCSFSVIIADTQSPTIACPADIELSTDAGQCTRSNVTYATTANDNCSGVSYGCVPSTGTTFAHGTNGVTCTATDASGNTNRCSFSVVIADAQGPTIACPANIMTSTDPGQCSKSNLTFAATATDNCSGVSYSCVPAGGSTFVSGIHSVTCMATDASGNMTNCGFTVMVSDTEAPLITCPADVTVTNAFGNSEATGVVLGEPTASDNCGIGSLTNDAPVSFPAGTNVVVWSAMDVHGNAAVCSQQVIVVLSAFETDNFRIMDIRVVGDDIVLTWQTAGNSSNVVQVATPTIDSAYVPLATIFVPGTGTVTTNWTDFGGATNGASRFYRIQLAP